MHLRSELQYLVGKHDSEGSLSHTCILDSEQYCRAKLSFWSAGRLLHALD